MRDRRGLLWVASDSGIGYFNSPDNVLTILSDDELNDIGERLVKATVQAPHTIDLGGSCREDQDQRSRRQGRELPTNLQSIETGKTEIENQEGVSLLLSECEALQPILGSRPQTAPSPSAYG